MHIKKIRFYFCPSGWQTLKRLIISNIGKKEIKETITLMYYKLVEVIKRKFGNAYQNLKVTRCLTWHYNFGNTIQKRNYCKP